MIIIEFQRQPGSNFSFVKILVRAPNRNPHVSSQLFLSPSRAHDLCSSGLDHIFWNWNWSIMSSYQTHMSGVTRPQSPWPWVRQDWHWHQLQLLRPTPRPGSHNTDTCEPGWAMARQRPDTRDAADNTQYILRDQISNSILDDKLLTT